MRIAAYMLLVSKLAMQAIEQLQGRIVPYMHQAVGFAIKGKHAFLKQVEHHVVPYMQQAAEETYAKVMDIDGCAVVAHVLLAISVVTPALLLFVIVRRLLSRRTHEGDDTPVQTKDAETQTATAAVDAETQTSTTVVVGEGLLQAVERQGQMQVSESTVLYQQHAGVLLAGMMVANPNLTEEFALEHLVAHGVSFREGGTREQMLRTLAYAITEPYQSSTRCWGFAPAQQP